MSFSLPFARTHARTRLDSKFQMAVSFSSFVRIQKLQILFETSQIFFFFFFLLLVSFSLQICRIKAQHLICVRCFKPCTTFVEIFSSLLPLHSVELFASHFDCCPCREFIGQLTPRRIDGNYNLN